MYLYTVNIKEGMPTTIVARTRLDQAIRTAKSRGATVLKIIHGYGSSGKGGAIKQDVKAFLKIKKIQGSIKGFVAGEDFSAFDCTARSIVDVLPEMRKDIDYGRSNHGVTIVLL